MTIAIFRPGARRVSDIKSYRSAFSLLLLCFTLGCLVASLFGGLLAGSPLWSFLISADYAQYVVISFTYLVVAIFLATTFLGYILMPILAFMRGFLLSLTAATIITHYRDAGVFMALTLIGIPSLITVPSYFVLSSECFLYSRNQMCALRGTPCAYESRLGLYTALCTLLCGAAALITLYLVPYLVSLMKG